MRRWLILGIASALLVIAGGFAYASIPDSAGVIHGCRKTSGGALRVIDSDAGQQCAGNETALNWNQVGLHGYEIVTQDEAIPSSTSVIVTISCPAGKRALGGSVTVQAGSTFSWPNGAFTQTAAELLTDSTYQALVTIGGTNGVAHKVVTCAFPS